MLDIQAEVSDFLYRLKERGTLANVTYHLNSKGEIIGFEVKITGFTN